MALGFSSSKPRFENPAYEMESVVIKQFGMAAEDDRNLIEEQKKPLDIQQEHGKEKGNKNVDLSKQEEQEVDMKKDHEQRKSDPCSSHDLSHNSQSLKEEDYKSNLTSGGYHSTTDPNSECRDFEGDHYLIHIDNVDPEKKSKSSCEGKESSDDDGFSSENQNASLPNAENDEKNNEENAEEND